MWYGTSTNRGPTNHHDQALNEAMREEMRRDVRVFIMGEDIQSGVYGASGGSGYQNSGRSGCGIALSENAFFGAAVGAAASARDQL